MQTTFENKGITKTITNNNGKKDENEIKWTANYDGEKTNINIDFSKNCKKDKLRLQLNNTDLADILGVKPVPISLEKRLKSNFLDSQSTDSETDNSDSESESSLLSSPNISSKNLTENIGKFLDINTITPKVQYKPKPYLFRVNVPKDKSESNEIKLLNHKSQKKMELINDSKTKPEILTVSEMLFDPAFDLSVPPIQLKEPTNIDLPSSLPTLTPETLLPLTVLNEIIPIKNTPSQGLRPQTLKQISKRYKNKLKSKRKNDKKGRLLYKTPSPKTYRIHLTSKGKRKTKSTTKSRKKSQKQTKKHEKPTIFNNF